MTRRPLHMHSTLACHGGAARVMELLATGLTAEGYAVGISCEEDDTLKETAPPIEVIAPESVASAVPLGAILHVHSTGNWLELLKSLVPLRAGISASGQPLNGPCIKEAPCICITLHDASLITGGCIAPGTCKAYEKGCLDSCPLGFSGAAKIQQQKLKFLEAIGPMLVSPSNFLLKMAKKTLPALKSTLIPNGVEENPFTKKQAREELSIPQAAAVIIFVAHGGSHALGKGGASWNRIWGQIKCAVPEALCFMIGGSRFEKAENLMEIPYLSRGEMQKFMAAADILVYPSLAENHPLVILEAMAAGTVPCAYDVGGVSEQIQHQQTGMLASLHNENELASHCVLLLKNTSLLRKISQNSLQNYKKYFKDQGMVNHYVSVYNSLG